MSRLQPWLGSGRAAAVLGRVEGLLLLTLGAIAILAPPALLLGWGDAPAWGRSTEPEVLPPSTTTAAIMTANAETTAAAPAAAGGRDPLAWWDSSRSAVIGLATGYGLEVYERFAGSLRETGYRGAIILGVDRDPPGDVRDYLERMNVTVREVEVTGNCTHRRCAAAYPRYKIQWGRFPLMRDWLLECAGCTDGVMLTDVRDVVFQADPFAYPFGNAPLERLPGDLMVFEEIANQTTDHRLTSDPVRRCRGFEFGGRPMLCSGSTMGTRRGIIEYVDTMVEEFDYWSSRRECRSGKIGDDQSVHNYLFYADRLKGAVSIPHRTGPIHIMGVEASRVLHAAIGKAKDLGHAKSLKDAEEFVNRRGFVDWDDEARGGTGWNTQWLPPGNRLIDPETGFFTNFDGRPSPQVHQVDRFGESIWGTVKNFIGAGGRPRG